MLDRIRREIGRRRAFSARMMILSSVITVPGFSAVCGSVMLDMRRSAETLAKQAMENLAASVDADIERNIEIFDQSLHAAASNLLLPEVSQVDAKVRNLILFDQSMTAGHFGPLRVFDANGDLKLDASTLTPAKLNRADAPFFTVHRDRPDVGLYVGPPARKGDSYSIVLSRRVTGADGSFQGVVAGTIRLSYFDELFGRLRLAPHDMIAVIAHDGTLIFRKPFVPELIGKDMKTTAGGRQMFTTKRGAFTGHGTMDGVERLFVWSDSTRPLVVLVATSWDDVLGTWRRQAMWIAGVVLALAAFVAAFTIFFIREIDRRAEAEHRLEELATTDPLTGLTNRRKFDAAIDHEWRRAQRNGTSVALLMIDADHFKAYNDEFGHQAGDQVLIGIAVCIADTVHRAGDCAARFGGEEFAVLLPGLGSEEALAMAETIRQKIAQWSDIERTATVSIGIASMTPLPPQHWADLVEAADRALYAAKDAGRDRCVVAGLRDVSMVA
ncbi:diguanylate cyclase [Rhodopseudomonas sp. B29]|uniref:sensor domain-containing diguanylate cyclase n=1 Tax=Rhodopseudomonas sp. B29 TaxID=95607 RepID=UPI0004CF92B9